MSSSNMLSPRTVASPITRNYNNLAGVDFLNDSSRVALNRSPDALNMYKNYTSSGECLQTRPGYRELANLNDNVFGIYFYEYNKGTIVVVHSGTKLYKWTNYPSSNIEDFEVLYDDMNRRKSVFFVFMNILYILDGKNYLFYDGTEVKPVSSKAYIPTTTIGREPSGGGEDYQTINVLQPKRKNQFVADGKSTKYVLDATNIDTDEVIITVNDVTLVENTDFTVNRALGIITFNTAPEEPSLSERDNVYVEFSKTIDGYINRISNCTLVQVFDNRVFFAGNPDFGNALFHCKLEEPSYVSDLDYYQDGMDNSAIKSICVGNNLLWVFKESNQQNNTIYYHTPTLDTTNGKIYPSAQGNISIGCYSDSCNFNDDIVFMTKNGLEGISGNIQSEQVLTHRSTLVDSKMINESNFEDTTLIEWQGYLLCLVNGKIFLADSRQLFKGINGREYEWYYWDGFSKETSKLELLREYRGILLLGFSNGRIGILEGTNDNGEPIIAYWTTPRDTFGSSNHYKTTNKKGGIIKLKQIPNSKVKIAKKTNKMMDEYKYIAEYAMTGFDFTNIDFNNLDFSNKNNDYLVTKIKEKKIIDISMKIYTDELDRPFGLYGLTLEAYLGGYVKR